MESLDIEKGRDMGINLYVKYLEMIGKPSPKSWDDYTTIPKNVKHFCHSYTHILLLITTQIIFR